MRAAVVMRIDTIARSRWSMGRSPAQPRSSACRSSSVAPLVGVSSDGRSGSKLPVAGAPEGVRLQVALVDQPDAQRAQRSDIRVHRVGGQCPGRSAAMASALASGCPRHTPRMAGRDRRSVDVASQDQVLEGIKGHRLTRPLQPVGETSEVIPVLASGDRSPGHPEGQGAASRSGARARDPGPGSRRPGDASARPVDESSLVSALLRTPLTRNDVMCDARYITPTNRV